MTTTPDPIAAIEREPERDLRRAAVNLVDTIVLERETSGQSKEFMDWAYFMATQAFKAQIATAALAAEQTKQGVEVKPADHMGATVPPHDAVLECLKDARKLLSDPSVIDLNYIDEVIAKAEGRSALVDVPAVESEPVAWRYRYEDGKWTVQKNKPHWFKEDMRDVELEPLYAHPPRSTLAPAPAGEDAWQPIETAPKDGSKFDAWCVNPAYPEGTGIRLTNVQMRGDNSGFGFVSYLREGVHWQYLDAREADSILPAWMPTHWRPLPAPPALSRKGSNAQTVGGGMATEAPATEKQVVCLTRYEPITNCSEPDMAEHPNGDWVRLDDVRECLRAKTLEWEGDEIERYGMHEFGYYLIIRSESGFSLSTFTNKGAMRPMGFHKALDDAEAEALTDYQRRLRTALAWEGPAE